MPDKPLTQVQAFLHGEHALRKIPSGQRDPGDYTPRHAAPEPRISFACTCYHDCGSCSLSGEWHVHPRERCPVHPDAPGDH